METIKITTHTELALRIMHLKSQKFAELEKFERSLKEFVVMHSPVMLIKDSLHELVGDKEVKFDLTKAGLNMGTNFLINKVLGNSVPGFLGTMLLEKISSSLINSNASKIISGITKLVQKKKQSD
jgi:hypothetical protein